MPESFIYAFYPARPDNAPHPWIHESILPIINLISHIIADKRQYLNVLNHSSRRHFSRSLKLIIEAPEWKRKTRSTNKNQIYAEYA